MWECFARRRPWDGVPPAQILGSVQRGGRPSPGLANGEVMGFVQRCWAQRKEERPDVAAITHQLRHVWNAR